MGRGQLCFLLGWRVCGLPPPGRRVAKIDKVSSGGAGQRRDLDAAAVRTLTEEPASWLLVGIPGAGSGGSRPPQEALIPQG